MIEASAALLFLLLAAAGIVWAVRRDDRRRAAHRTAKGAGAPLVGAGDSIAAAPDNPTGWDFRSGDSSGDGGGGD